VFWLSELRYFVSQEQYRKVFGRNEYLETCYYKYSVLWKQLTGTGRKATPFPGGPPPTHGLSGRSQPLCHCPTSTVAVLIGCRVKARGKAPNFEALFQRKTSHPTIQQSRDSAWTEKRIDSHLLSSPFPTIVRLVNQSLPTYALIYPRRKTRWRRRRSTSPTSRRMPACQSSTSMRL
jgi:hypothetical protein